MKKGRVTGRKQWRIAWKKGRGNSNSSVWWIVKSAIMVVRKSRQYWILLVLLSNALIGNRYSRYYISRKQYRDAKLSHVSHKVVERVNKNYPKDVDNVTAEQYDHYNDRCCASKGSTDQELRQGLENKVIVKCKATDTWRQWKIAWETSERVGTANLGNIKNDVLIRNKSY